MTKTITLTTREAFSYAVIGAIACFAAGVALFAIVMALVVLPNRDAETLQRVESAYIKGAMLKISSTSHRCQSWAIRKDRAVCE